MKEDKKFYTDREEKANYLTHAFGVFMAVIATIVLLRKAIVADNGWAIIAYTIFAFGMLACMLSSTIYHFVQVPKAKAILRHFDHANIYVLIAATYSPFTLILLRDKGMWGWGLFSLIWLIALVGIGFNFRTLKANNHFKTASYVLMGLCVKRGWFQQYQRLSLKFNRSCSSIPVVGKKNIGRLCKSVQYCKSYVVAGILILGTNVTQSNN